MCWIFPTKYLKSCETGSFLYKTIATEGLLEKVSNSKISNLLIVENTLSSLSKGTVGISTSLYVKILLQFELIFQKEIRIEYK
jgi:hypothetical protein